MSVDVLSILLTKLNAVYLIEELEISVTQLLISE